MKHICSIIITIIFKLLGEVPVLLIGTKLDLVLHNPHIREVETRSGEELQTIRRNIIEYAEVSAKEGMNVDASFLKLAKELKKRVDVGSGNCKLEQNFSNVYSGHRDTVQVDKESRTGGCC